MTWVIGGITPFGYGVGISDIRVSWGEAKHKDCLQKVYPVGNFLIAGFAGSVYLGFKMIEDLKAFLSLDAPDQAWIPEWVAVKWRRRARRIFKEAPESQQRLGASILLVGIHPNQNEGKSPWPKGLACALMHDKFELMPAKRGEFLSIGSGGDVEEYARMLRESTGKHAIATMQAEVAMRGGYAHSIKMNITESLMTRKEKTVSPHLHIFIAERGKLSIGTNNHIRSGKNGPVKFSMPSVAQSYSDFQALCEKDRTDPAAAIC